MEELDQIIKKMIDAGESEDSIKSVVRSYKQQKEKKAQDPAVDPTVSQDNTGSKSEDGSSESQNDDIDYKSQRR